MMNEMRLIGLNGLGADTKQPCFNLSEGAALAPQWQSIFTPNVLGCLVGCGAGDKGENEDYYKEFKMDWRKNMDVLSLMAGGPFTNEYGHIIYFKYRERFLPHHMYQDGYMTGAAPVPLQLGGNEYRMPDTIPNGTNCILLAEDEYHRHDDGFFRDYGLNSNGQDRSKFLAKAQKFFDAYPNIKLPIIFDFYTTYTETSGIWGTLGACLLVAGGIVAAVATGGVTGALVGAALAAGQKAVAGKPLGTSDLVAAAGSVAGIDTSSATATIASAAFGNGSVANSVINYAASNDFDSLSKVFKTSGTDQVQAVSAYVRQMTANKELADGYELPADASGVNGLGAIKQMSLAQKLQSAGSITDVTTISNVIIGAAGRGYSGAYPLAVKDKFGVPQNYMPLMLKNHSSEVGGLDQRRALAMMTMGLNTNKNVFNDLAFSSVEKKFKALRDKSGVKGLSGSDVMYMVPFELDAEKRSCFAKALAGYGISVSVGSSAAYLAEKKAMAAANANKNSKTAKSREWK